MRGAKGVVFALDAAGEAGYAAVLSQRRHPLPPPGENLMGVGLVADIPDQAIMGRIEYIVQRHGELDRAEIGRQVAAGVRHRMNQVVTQFPGELRELLAFECAHVRRIADLLEKFVHVRDRIQNRRNTIKSASWRSCPPF